MMLKKFLSFTFLTPIFVFYSCAEVTKETAKVSNQDEREMWKKWQVQRGRDYPFRPELLEKVVNDSTLRKMSRAEIFQTLGKPTRTDSLYLFYRVQEKKLGFLTLHTTSLVIKMKNDSILHWIKVHQ